MFFTAIPGFCQGAAELLQKGIYAQESVGDLDQAMQIYRQIVSSGADQKVAAQAQFMLAQCLIRKGDLTRAAQEFAALAQNFANYREVIARLARESGIVLHTSPSVESLQAQLEILRQRYTESYPDIKRIEAALTEAARTRGSLAVVLNNRYHHNITGVEFDLPPGWSHRITDMSSDNGQMAILSEAYFSDAFIGVWMIQEQIRPENITARLRLAIPEKIRQRDSFHNYAMRTESIQLTTINARQAIRAVADFDDEGGKKTEIMAWIFTEKTRAFFHARIKSEDAAGFQPRFEQVIQSAQVP
ncbi:MAG TPA: hypothetical protein VIX89_19170 [Bryobacteraceae bacterium]